MTTECRVSSDSSVWWAHAGMLVWATLVGLSFPAVGMLSEGLPPLSLTALRFVIAALAVLPLVWGAPGLRPSLAGLGLYGLMGLCLASFFGTMPDHPGRLAIDEVGPILMLGEHDRLDGDQFSDGAICQQPTGSGEGWMVHRDGSADQGHSCFGTGADHTIGFLHGVGDRLLGDDAFGTALHGQAR